MSLFTLYGDHGTSTAVATCTLAAVVAAGLYLLHQWLLPKPLPGIPYNPEATKSIWGDGPALARHLSANGEFSAWLGEQNQKLKSPVVQVFLHPFRLPWILVGDFHEAQDILMRRTDIVKPQFIINCLAMMGDFHGLSRTADEKFKLRRQLRQDLMTPNFLNTYVGPAAHAQGLMLVSLFQAKATLAKGRPFRVREDYARAVLDLMLHYAFGDGFDDLAMQPQLDLISTLTPSCIPGGRVDEPVSFPEAPRSLFVTLLHETAESMERASMSPMPQLSLWWWSQQAWYKRIVSERYRVIEEQLQKAAANLQGGRVRSALEHMMKREQATAQKQGRVPQIISQSMSDEIFADPMTGHHTTSGALTWVTKYLTGYQDSQRRLRDELYASIPQAVQENRPPTFEELRCARLPYLDAVIEEARRLTPFPIMREAARDLDILGHKIPKGAQLFMLSAGPGILLPSLPVDDETRSPTSKAARRRGAWDESRDLKLFEPERWLVAQEDGSLAFDAAAGPQLGFGMGIRQCWGRRLAQLAVRTVIALVVWEFEMLAMPEDLGGYEGVDGITREPVKAFVRLRKMTPYLV